MLKAVMNALLPDSSHVHAVTANKVWTPARAIEIERF
jgi:hypothetical protein